MNTKMLVNGIEVGFTCRWIKIRRFRWIPKWLPFCSADVAIVTFDKTPPLGAIVSISYEGKDDA